ncbi:MAG: cytidine deaminase [Treponema sp.]|nr:MAG: cytidine deaminase [Treponema sp.]
MKNSIQPTDLFYKALEVAKNAYAPYSKFHVGAALLTESGEIITGVNVENRSYGLTNCAERTAIFKAVCEQKSDKIAAIAIATPDSEYPVPPCGACRQVMSEFMSYDTPVIFGSNESNLVHSTVGEIYPFDSLHELKKN